MNTETPSSFHPPQWMLQYRFWKASDWQHLQNNAVRAHVDKKTHNGTMDRPPQNLGLNMTETVWDHLD